MCRITKVGHFGEAADTIRGITGDDDELPAGDQELTSGDEDDVTTGDQEEVRRALAIIGPIRHFSILAPLFANRMPADEDSDPSESDSEGGSEDYEGPRAIFDFESENSQPALVLKSFLSDCLKHPKILMHKDFQFFRDYLMRVGLRFEISSHAPFQVDHEDNKFCVDWCDSKWLNELIKRSEPDSSDYWASITPLEKRLDIGLIRFEWKPFRIALTFLKLYVEYRTKVLRGDDVEGAEELDEHAENFIQRFKLTRNMDVEERYNDDVEATRLINLRRKEVGEPQTSDAEFDLLFKVSRKRKSEQSLVPNAKRNKTAKSDSDSSSKNDTESSSESDSDGSEYKGKYVVKGHRRRRLKKQNANQKGNANGSIKKSTQVTNGAVKPTAPHINGSISRTPPRINKSVNKPATQTSDPIQRTPSASSRLAAFKKTEPRNNGTIKRTPPCTSDTIQSTVTKINEAIKNTTLRTTDTIQKTNGAIRKLPLRSNRAIHRTPTPPSTSLAIKRTSPRINGAQPIGKTYSLRNTNTTESNTFVCNKCKTNYSSNQSLRLHNRKVHSTVKKQLFETCSCGKKIRQDRFIFHKRVCFKGAK